MPIQHSLLIDRLQTLAPFADEEAAQRAWRATLRALRSGLTDDEADWIAIDLGPDLAAPLVAGVQPVIELTPDIFYRAVARLASQRRSLAQEQAQVVCRVLAEQLSPSTTARLCRSLPQLAALFAPAQTPEPASGPHHLRSELEGDHTLAGGRPGGDRPLYDARRTSDAEMPGVRSTRGHTHSVAASNDPHSDTKLSSARGLGQKRESASLASARQPGHR